MAYYDLEEQEQISELKAWWRRWGALTIAFVIVGGLALGAFQGWQWYRGNQAAKAAALYQDLSKAVQARDAKKAGELAQQLADGHPNSGYAVFGALAAARLSFETGDLKAARARLEWANTKARDPGLKDLAKLRLAGVLLDDKQYDEALGLLEVKQGDPQANLVADLRGDVLVAKGNLAEARSAYQTALERTDAKSPYRNLIQLKLDALGDTK